jgi:hypothetical protein
MENGLGLCIQEGEAFPKFQTLEKLQLYSP